MNNYYNILKKKFNNLEKIINPPKYNSVVGFSLRSSIAASNPVKGIPIVTIGKTHYFMKRKIAGGGAMVINNYGKRRNKRRIHKES